MTLLILITFTMEGPIFLRDDKTFFFLFQRHPSCIFLCFLLSYAGLDQLLRIFLSNQVYMTTQQNKMSLLVLLFLFLMLLSDGICLNNCICPLGPVPRAQSA